MIELTLTTTVWFIGLIGLSFYVRSPLLSLLTGLSIVYEALLYTQTDKMFSLLLAGFALIMIGYAMVFSEYTIGWFGKFNQD